MDNRSFLNTTCALPGPDAGQDLARMYRETLGRTRRASLLIYHREGAELVPLLPDRPVVVGRGPGVEVSIRDDALSRRHARFEVRQDQVWVEDLGSTNGTLVNGEKVERARVETIDQLSLGSLPVILNTLDPLEERLYGLDGHDRFLARLDEEAARARTLSRTLTLVLIQAPSNSRERLHHWCPDIRRLLRPFDRLGLYGPAVLELLLPEVTRAQAEELSGQVLEIGEEAGLALSCGLAALPEHGAAAGQLMEAARGALQGASAGQLSWAAPGTTRVIPVETEDGGEPAPRDAPVLRSPRMQEVFAMVDRVAPSALPVLIQGETGTGKEVVARALHRKSGRLDRKLCCVNCGAIPLQLVESALFGHEKGAFTGAHQRSRGVFETARDGTVLLDEIGEMALDAQASLLRVLESGHITPVGSTREIPVDVRILASTNRDLEASVKEGRFRQDLLFRLNAVTVDLPPLRRRKEDILPLAHRFIQQANLENERDVTGIDAAALKLLLAYPWPGNIRELRNALQRAVVICQGQTLVDDDLPARVRQVVHALPSPEPAPEAGGGEGLKELVQRYEADLIRHALEQSDRDRSDAAELLGVPVRTLAYKMKQYGIRLRR